MLLLLLLLLFYGFILYYIILQAMEEMVKQGKVSSIGVSNFNSEQVQRIIDNSTIKPVNLQVVFSINEHVFKTFFTVLRLRREKSI